MKIDMPRTINGSWLLGLARGHDQGAAPDAHARRTNAMDRFPNANKTAASFTSRLRANLMSIMPRLRTKKTLQAIL